MAIKYQLAVQLLTGKRGPAPVLYDGLEEAKAAKATIMEHGVSQGDGTDNNIVEIGWPAGAIACVIIGQIEEVPEE